MSVTPCPPPLLFRFARELVRRRLRGGYQIIEWLERRGRLNHTTVYKLSDRVAVEMPLWRRPNQLNLTEARQYERPLVDAVERELDAIGLPAVLVDCGADVGLLAGLLVARSRQIEEVVACEPNAEAFRFLTANLARWPVRSRGLAVGVADFAGRGRLCQPDYQTSPHSAYLEADPMGDVEVARVDDFQFDVGDRSLLLKIDVEGGEWAAVAGALETLRRARRWIVTIEAHRQVYARTGIDPGEVVRLLAPVGLNNAYVAERPNISLDWSRPYFEQVAKPAIGNLVCVSRGR